MIGSLLFFTERLGYYSILYFLKNVSLIKITHEDITCPVAFHFIILL